MSANLRTEVIFREDLRALLDALSMAVYANENQSEYARGFVAGLDAVAAAYDVSGPSRVAPSSQVESVKVRYQIRG